MKVQIQPPPMLCSLSGPEPSMGNFEYSSELWTSKAATMSAAFFGAFQPRHLQIMRGGWRLPSRTSHSPLSSPLASKNRRCSIQLVMLDAQSEAETGVKLARVQVNAALPRSEMHSWAKMPCLIYCVFFRGSSAGFTYLSSHGPILLSCTTVGSFSG